MNRPDPKLLLQDLTAPLLSESIDYLALKNAIEGLKELLWDISGLDPADEKIMDPIQLETGYAIGPKWAGMCLEDFMRTKQFTKGIYEAVKDLRMAKPHKPVHLFYIGTGPFATLILPLLTRFSPSELQLEFLEVNKTSVESVHRILESFDALDYIIDIHHADALKFKCSEQHTEIDLVIVECLQHALMREPQVAIAHHILPQLSEEVIMIPEDITLAISLVDYTKKMQSSLQHDTSVSIEYAEKLDSIFSLNKESILEYHQDDSQRGLRFPEVFTAMEALEHIGGKSLSITTEISVYKNHRLEIDQSGLTVPMILAQFNGGEKLKGIKSRYVLDESPHIWTEIVPS